MDFLDAEDLHGEDVAVSVMKMGGVRRELVGGCGLRAENEVAQDGSLLLLWTVVITGSDWLSWGFVTTSSCCNTKHKDRMEIASST